MLALLQSPRSDSFLSLGSILCSEALLVRFIFTTARATFHWYRIKQGWVPWEVTGAPGILPASGELSRGLVAFLVQRLSVRTADASEQLRAALHGD